MWCDRKTYQKGCYQKRFLTIPLYVLMSKIIESPG